MKALSAAGPGPGTAIITGLPFTIIDSGASVACYAANMANLNGPVIVNAGGPTNTFNLYQSQASGVLLLNQTNFTNTTFLRGTITFKVL